MRTVTIYEEGPISFPVVLWCCRCTAHHVHSRKHRPGCWHDATADLHGFRRPSPHRRRCRTL